MTIASKAAADGMLIPSVVISLDFEMEWGFHDNAFDCNSYKENLYNEREVVSNILKLFSERNIRATWACVGALACNDWNEYFTHAPRPPKYVNQRFVTAHKYSDADPDGHYHFAPELLKTIQKTLGQKLGSHTFSHMYLREKGVTAQDVLADVATFSVVWKEKLNESPVSFVFPRNQVAFLTILTENGIKIWRGNETSWYFNCNESSNNKIAPRILRILDAVNPLIKRAAPLTQNMTSSSLFFRAGLPNLAWQLHLSRICNELDSLQYPNIFHLWFHPHNLGVNMKIQLERLRIVLDIIADKLARNLLLSQSMEDLVKLSGSTV